MPIVDIQRRFRELGRLRMGVLERPQGGRPRPVKLATWRLTTRWRHLLDAAVELGIGGEVRPWEAPDGPQFELITEADRLEVIVPPGDVLSQWYELWTGGGCQRRCDGVTMVLDNGKTSDRPCRCPADPQERLDAAKANPPTGCRETTRLVVMLPGLPDLGVWRLESHGFYAAVELGGAASLVELATRQGTLIPAALGIEQRRVKRPGEPVRRFAVPVLSFRGNLGDTLTALGMVDGDTPVAIGAGVRPPIGELPAAPLEAEATTDLPPAGTFAKPEPIKPTPDPGPDERPEPEAFDPPARVTEEEASSAGGSLPPDRFLAMRARDAGLADVDRRLTYRAITGKTSGKDLTVEEVNRVAGILAMVKTGRIKVGLTPSGAFTVYDVEAKRGLYGIAKDELDAERDEEANAAADAPAEEVDPVEAAIALIDELGDRPANELTEEEAAALANAYEVSGIAPPPLEDDEAPVDGELVDEPPAEAPLEEQGGAGEEEAVVVDEAPADTGPGPMGVELPGDAGALRDLIKSHGIAISTALRRTGKANLAGVIGDRDVLLDFVAWLEAGAKDDQ
jgi:hypothetical protein